MTPESQLQQELGQRRPFSSTSQEALIGVLRTADQLKRHLELVMAGHEITLQQFNVLRILRGAGPDGLPTLTIGTRMIERAPGVTRLLDRLEARGLVQRSRSTADRRQVVCTLSKLGTKVLAALDAPVLAADGNAMRALSPDEQAELVHLLDRVRADLAQREQDADALR